MGICRLFFLIPIFMLISCGTTSQQIQRDAKYQLKTADRLEIQKSNMLLDITQVLRPLLIDEYARDYCTSIFTKHTEKYPDPMIFQDKIAEINTSEAVVEKLSAEFRDILEANNSKYFSVYAPSELRLECVGQNRLAFKSNVKKQNEISGVLDISAQFNKACRVFVQMTNRYAHPTMSGVANLQLDYGKREDNQIDFSLKAFKTESDRDLGVTKTINSEEIMRSLNDAFIKVSADARRLSKTMANSITEEVKSGLNNRFITKPEESIKTEKVYNINFDAAVSRLQRGLNRYKFEKDSSSFWFSDNKSMVYGGKNIPCESRIDVRLFPEKSGKTAVVYDMRYGTIYDNLASKEHYGKEQAKSEFNYMIERTSATLAK
jgi:hypothetical protein